MPVRLLNRFRHAALACLLGSLSLNAAADPVTLTLYNGQHAATGIAIAKAFQDKTGIQVKIRKGGDGQLASQITEEGARSPADVLYTEESPPLIRLASAGLLAKLEPETLALVEPEHAGGNGDWIGITARTRVLAYNPKKIDEKDLPKSLMDLSDPSWSGRFGFVPTSGAFLEQVAAVIKLKGQEEAEDWLTGLKAFGSIYTNNVTAMKAVENGEVDMALINNYYWYTLKKEKGELNSRLHYFGNQDPGALVTVSGAAVLKSSKHPREVRAGIGQVFGATRELFIPQMINLQAVGGVSFKKGCYTGQEIVARMQYLGRLKRRLYRLALDADEVPAPGTGLFSPVHSTSVGEVVLAARTPENSVELLAVLQDDAVADGRISLGSAEGAPLVLLNLPYTLDSDREIQR